MSTILPALIVLVGIMEGRFKSDYRQHRRMPHSVVRLKITMK
jgi:hypothetical protein